MLTLQEIADQLADEWQAMMGQIEWQDFAESIRRRAPAPCGETTSIETSFGLCDVSDCQAWVGEEGGDIRLTIEVYGPGADEPFAKRIIEIPRPA
jgi:hypothetical protein